MDRLYTNPKRIFSLPDQKNTYIEVDLDEEWAIPAETKYCRSKWTPFAGRQVRGCVRKVVLRGQVAFIDGQVGLLFIWLLYILGCLTHDWEVRTQEFESWLHVVCHQATTLSIWFTPMFQCSRFSRAKFLVPMRGRAASTAP